MKRNKAAEFKIIQQIAGKNMAAVNVLCACADKNRFDIVEFIRQLNRQDANMAINPDMIVKLYTEKCNSDVDMFISLIDKQFDKAKEMHKYFSYE